MADENAGSLEAAGDFALRLAAEQAAEREVEGVDDGVDDERAAAFMAQAMSRSQKYQKERQKSEKKLSALHDSLEAEHGTEGVQQIEMAMAEHASEALIRSGAPQEVS